MVAIKSALTGSRPGDVDDPALDWPMLVVPRTRWADIFPARSSHYVMRVDEFTENGTLVLQAEVPGIDAERDVEIVVRDGTLSIVAVRSEDDTSAGRDFRRRELHYGSFARTFALPAGVTPADVSASYDNGILEVRVDLTHG